MVNEEKFNELLAEYNSIKEKYDAMSIKIIKKHADIDANISNENPTDEEYDEWDLLSRSFWAIDKRIRNLFE